MPPPRRVTNVVHDGYDDLWINYFDDFPEPPISVNYLRVMGRRKDLMVDRTPRDEEDFVPTDLERFARHGGPDMSHLCGLSCDNAKVKKIYDDEKAKVVWSHQFYGADVYRYLQMYGIVYDERESHYANSGRLSAELNSRVPTVAAALPATIARQVKQAFERAESSHGTGYGDILALLLGDNNLVCGRNTLFDGFSPITKMCPLTPRPELYDGVPQERLAELLKAPGFSGILVPSRNPREPAAPNFFLEMSGPYPTPKIHSYTKTQYVGAYGVRAMEFLKNYGKESPVYNANAYVFSVIFDSDLRQLNILVHYQTPANPPQAPMEMIHTAQIGQFGLLVDEAECKKGIATLRIVREMAAEAREMLVNYALSKVK